MCQKKKGNQSKGYCFDPQSSGLVVSNDEEQFIMSDLCVYIYFSRCIFPFSVMWTWENHTKHNRARWVAESAQINQPISLWIGLGKKPKRTMNKKIAKEMDEKNAAVHSHIIGEQTKLNAPRVLRFSFALDNPLARSRCFSFSCILVLECLSSEENWNQFRLSMMLFFFHVKVLKILL